MKRLSALMIAALLCVCLLAACGGNSGGNSAEQSTTADSTESPAVTGETFDAGNVSAIVPAGWKAFPQKDVFADDKDATNPDTFYVAKGAENELDLFSKPYILIYHYAPTTTMIAPSKNFYDDAVDLPDMTIGEHTWHGFTCNSLGYKYHMLWTGENNEDQFQVSVLYESTDGSVKLEDADVQAIIASVKASK